MSRRGENIYKRKDGRGEGILKQDRKYQYFYARKYKELKQKMIEYQENTKRSIEKHAGKLEHDHAAGLFEAWLDGDICLRIKPSTYENYYCCMHKYVIPFYRRDGNREITEASVLRFVKTVREDNSIAETSQKKILSIFKMALKEILKGAPNYLTVIETIKLPRTEASVVNVFTMKEQRLIEYASITSEDKKTLGILLCFYTGIRLGELCALKWSDIDLEAGTVSIVRTVSRTKNFEAGNNRTILLVGSPKSRKSIRKIPLPVFLLKLLGEKRPLMADESCYMLSGKNIPLDPRCYQKFFKKLLKDTGLKSCKFHTIRHTFATRALELGIDIKTLSEILGHSNVSITLNIYAHSLMEHKKAAIEKFNNMYIMNMKLTSFAVTSAVSEVSKV
jgi:integrase